MLSEYVGGNMACTKTQDGSLRYLIINKKRDKAIVVTLNSETAEIVSIDEEPLRVREQKGKIIEIRKYMKED